MSAANEHINFVRLVHKFEPASTLLRAWDLTGGVSARVTALEIERPDGATKKMIVRRHGAVDLQRNPAVAAVEFRLLQILQSVGVPAPAPYYLDQSGEIFPAPCVVVEYVDGRPEFAPADPTALIHRLAAQLSAIHHVDGSHLDLSFLPQQDKVYAEKFSVRPAKLDDSIDEGRIRLVLESVWPLPQRNASVLLHGDFWPGNILWKDGRLVAVIDWEDAQVGDPLADLANCRFEILWAFGVDAMRRFTQHYRSLTTIDITNLPYWDLCAALRPAFKIAEWAADARAEHTMRERHSWYTTHALSVLRRRQP
jgi:aminoglycoside phosphotransferase (APT) family kinase protein